MMYDITNAEKESLKIYKGFNYEAINQLLTSNVDIDIAYIKASMENDLIQAISYKKDEVIKYIEIVKNIYELMIKNDLNSEKKKDFKYVRGTSLEEITRLTSEPYIDRMLSVTNNSDIAEYKYASKYNNPAIVNVFGSVNIPKICVADVLDDVKENDEYIIAPFTQIVDYKDMSVLDEVGNIRNVYNIYLEKQKLEELSAPERKALYTFILQSTDQIDKYLKECVELECEIENLEEEMLKLEQLFKKYEEAVQRKTSNNDNNDSIDITEDIDNLDRVKKETKVIKNDLSNKKARKKSLMNSIITWKRNVILYLMAECKEIEYKYNPKDEIEELNIVKDSVEQIEEIVESVQEKEITKEKIKEVEYEEMEDLSKEIKLQVEENKNKVNTLLDNINNLINKEQNHARVAGNIGSVYSALNNGFEMRKIAEVLKNQIEEINLKKNAIIESEDENKLEKLEEISKVNIQIGTLINYLNNPKTAIPGTQITRFDEMLILEENELKRGIAERIRDLLGEAELRKLKDDLEYLEERTPFARFIGMFTGQNKLDDFMIDQIEIRRDCIKKKMLSKMSLAYNYSIHELVAKLRMFYRENNDDDLVEDTVNKVSELEAELKRNFVINDTRVETIIYAKEGKELPVDSNKKISKMEQLEIDTYQFLEKYEYSFKEDIAKEEKYQDTLANEIATIVEYINTSNILK